MKVVATPICAPRPPMLDRRQIVSESLAECISRLDVILKPWGFSFVPAGINSSHVGPYASGHYCRDATRIGLSCRDTVDNVYYEHSFVTNFPFHSKIERFTVGHDTLMDRLGHADDCWLVASNSIPNVVSARDGGNCVEALIHDLQLFAAAVLRQPCDDFCEIVRCGWRALSIERPSGGT